MKRFHALIAMGASFILAPFFSAHAVTVVDSASTRQVAQESAQRATQAANSELFNQVQLLQEEVMRTRGMIEELQFQVQELKQQRLDDYKNLDKRISELGQRPTPSLAQSAVPPASEGGAMQGDFPLPEPRVPVAATNPDRQDAIDYRQAYELIKQRKFDQAKEAFSAFIGDYPDSEFRPNAHYWLGELYIIEGSLVKAKSEFQVILKNYPAHSKHPEALYKIAAVNYELGDRMTAKLQMQQLVEQYGDKPVNAVTKARDFLTTNFP